MKRIILHWTAGQYKPNAHELECYHFLIDGFGNIHKGIFSVKDNENCTDGIYAHHCGGGNTGSIGVTVCAMLNKDFPVKPIQLETMYRLCAKLCKEYNIPISTETIITHHRFSLENPKVATKGKIDLYYLDKNTIVNKIKWYSDNMEIYNGTRT